MAHSQLMSNLDCPRLPPARVVMTLGRCSAIWATADAASGLLAE